MGTRQKNERGDSKGELNDSPEIPDREERSDIPSTYQKLVYFSSPV